MYCSITLFLVEPGMYFNITFFLGVSSIYFSNTLFLGKPGMCLSRTFFLGEPGVYFSNNFFCVKHSFYFTLICSCVQPVSTAVALCCCCLAANESINVQQFYTNCIGRNSLLYEKLALTLLIEKPLASHRTRSSMTIFARARNSTFHSSKIHLYINHTSTQRSAK
jgi:hypothetical protein